jgi:hypothetical protein
MAGNAVQQLGEYHIILILKYFKMTKEDLKKINYQSWQNGNEWNDKELDFIIKKDCACDNCGESVDEFNDFPELLIEEDELLCEQCYHEKYRKTCPNCEESYDIKDGESDYSVKTEEDARKENEVAGIYHLGNLLIPININYLKRIRCGENCCEVYSEDICPDCVSDLVRKDNFIKSHGNGTPCILIKEYENDSIFKDWTAERFKREKQRLIHKRITIRGIIETANKIQY